MKELIRIPDDDDFHFHFINKYETVFKYFFLQKKFQNLTIDNTIREVFTSVSQVCSM